MEERNEEKNNFDYENNLDNNIKNKKNPFKYLLIVSLIFFSVFGAYSFVTSLVSKNEVVTSKVTATKEDKENEALTVNAIKKAKDAVVSVINYQKSSKNSTLQSLIDDSNKNDGLKPASSGSGVIYKKENSKAYVVTNNHVIDGAEKLTVVLSDGKVVQAKLVGRDIWTDLAVLEIDAEYVTTVMSFADSNNVAVGETSLAIGSPLDVNLSNTVTKGIISAVNRQIPIDIDKDGESDWHQTVLQTDAAINPGNSGGALINTSGELIGINELKIANAGSNISAEGIGFVIPSNEVKIITSQLEKNGKVIRPALGIQLIPLSQLDSKTIKEKLFITDTKVSGVVIKSVEKNSPAELAGLREYDVITKINDENISSVAELRKYLFEKVNVGDSIKVKYLHLGEERETYVKLKELN